MTNKSPPPPSQKKKLTTLAVLSCGLISLLGYEVYTHHSSLDPSGWQTVQSASLANLEKDLNEDLVADLSSGIGKPALSIEDAETIDALRAQLELSHQQLSHLRARLLTHGSLVDSPRVCDLKQQIEDLQLKHTNLLQKKKMLKQELMSLKDLLDEKCRQYQVLASKKKVLKDEYLKLQQQLDQSHQSNTELYHELNGLKISHANLQNSKKTGDLINSTLLNRNRNLKDKLKNYTKNYTDLQKKYETTLAELDSMQAHQHILEDQNKEYLQQVNHLSDQLSKSQEEVQQAQQQKVVALQDLKNQIADLENQLALAKANSSSTPSLSPLRQNEISQYFRQGDPSSKENLEREYIIEEPEPINRFEVKQEQRNSSDNQEQEFSTFWESEIDNQDLEGDFSSDFSF